MKNIEDKLSLILAEIQKLNEKIANIEKNVAVLKYDPLIKQAVIETNEDVKQILNDQKLLMASQQRQDKILEALAMRSLEQETDIRDLKRIK